MTQVGTVQQILPCDRAEIAVLRKSACGHECEDCAGCGASGSAVIVSAENPVGASVGDKVIVESSTSAFFRVALLVYCVPVLLFFVGYFAARSIFGGETAAGCAAALSFVLGLAPAVFCDRRLRKTGGFRYTIIRTVF